MDHPKSKPKIPQEIRFQDCTILNYLFGWILVLKFAAAEHTNPFCGLRHRCQCWSNHLGLWPRLLTQDLLVWGVFFLESLIPRVLLMGCKKSGKLLGCKKPWSLGGSRVKISFVFFHNNKKRRHNCGGFSTEMFSCTEEHKGQAHFLK